MEVFHYCALELKDRDIFVSCTGKALKSQKRIKTGAIYNDVENDPFNLLLDDDTGSPTSAAEQLSSPTEFVANMLISQNEVDTLFLQADADDPLRYHFDHDLYSTEATFSCIYREKVFQVVECWDNLPIYKDHIQR